MTNSRALVLGGGGPVGIAWETGVLAGLALEGLEVGADLVLGTSAGSFVGVDVARGRAPVEMAEAQKAMARQEQAGGGGMHFDATAFDALMGKMIPGEEPSRALMLEFGALSKAGAVVTEELYLAYFQAQFTGHGAWPEAFACTAVNVDTGEFKVFTARDQVDLTRAVAASCSVPGIFPPVSLAGHGWMDGGVRSSLSADAAAGHRRVLAFSVQTALTGPIPAASLAQEAAIVHAAGGELRAILPDAQALAVFPDNLMDARKRAVIVEAGIAQGRREAAALRGWWG